MRCEDGVVFLRDVRLYAFHGVLPQERRVGGWFLVSLRVHYYNVMKACSSDDVDDTLNYAVLLDIVRREMQQPSSLLEHVAGRIARSVFDRYPDADSVDVTLTKENPPMGGSLQGAGVELHLINDKTRG
ncbi:MAG: dihydroneopterin aldolase [Prevotella sp.]|nr:dihydroneopterin aldolase [Prevotella sp.]